MAAALEAGVTRLFRVGGAHAIARWPTARTRCRASTRSSVPATATSPRPRRSSPPTAASTSTPGPTEIVIVAARGPAAWIAADLIAQAEHDPDARAVLITPSRRAGRTRARARRGAMPADGPARAVDRARTAASSSRAHRAEAMDLANASAPSISSSTTRRWRREVAARARCSSARGRRRSPATTPSGRTTCCRRPARARARRAVGRRLRPRRSRCSALTRARACAGSADRDDAGDGRRAARARRLDRRKGEVMTVIHDFRVSRSRARASGCTSTRTPAAARRACSRRFAAVRRERRLDLPVDYRARWRARAHFGVDPDWVLLTNGLDEGILMAAVGSHRARARTTPRRSFRCRRSIRIPIRPRGRRDGHPRPPGPDFAFPTEAVIDAITPRTRMIFLNTPNNPTGQLIPIDAISPHREAAPTPWSSSTRRTSSSAATLPAELPAVSQRLIGRTFSKAYGLAGMRVGVVIGQPQVARPVRAVTLPFNINGVAWSRRSARARGSRVPAVIRRAGGGVARAALRRVPAARAALLAERGQFRARPRRRRRAVRRGAGRRGVHVRDRSKTPARRDASASPPASSNTPTPRSRRWKRSSPPAAEDCAWIDAKARRGIRSATTETQIA